MKKANVINLIKYYTENNDKAFRNEAYIIADEFEKSNDYQLSEYIISLLAGGNVFYVDSSEPSLSFVKKVNVNGDPLPMPKKIESEIMGIVNATSHNIGVNKFLFQGAPGTGKTESAKHLARILNRDFS